MKVLITTDMYLPMINGVVTSIVQLKKELMNLGHDVRVLTLDYQSDDQENNTYYLKSFPADLIYPNVRITVSRGMKEIDDIVEWGPDVVHSQCEFNTYFKAKSIAKKLNIPIVHTYHTVYEDYVHYMVGSEGINKRLVGLVTKRILNNMDAIIAPTNKVDRLLKRYDVKKPIEVIPTGIDTNRFAKEVPDKVKAKVKHLYGIGKEDLLLVFLGRVGKEKNIDEIIDYLNQYNDPRVKLLIVGDGPYRSALESYVKTLGMKDQVKFTGMVDQDMVQNYYQTADLFVSASQSETQGLTYIEALANGIPALCRDDACLDGVILDYRNGLRYKNYDEFQSFLHMIQHHEDVRKSTSYQARLHAFSFSSENFGKSVEKLYRKVIRNYSV